VCRISLSPVSIHVLLPPSIEELLVTMKAGSSLIPLVQSRTYNISPKRSPASASRKEWETEEMLKRNFNPGGKFQVFSLWFIISKVKHAILAQPLCSFLILQQTASSVLKDRMISQDPYRACPVTPCLNPPVTFSPPFLPSFRHLASMTHTPDL
jgi:hypothetical protein